MINKEGGPAVGEISKSTTYLFEQIRNIGANYGSVLTQFVGMLPSIFDPFSKMTKALIPMSEMSEEFFRVFRTTTENLNAHVDKMRESGTDAEKGAAIDFRKQVSTRGAVFTVADFLAGTGAMDAVKAAKIKDSMVGKDSMSIEGIKGLDAVATDAFKTMFSSLMSSDLIEELGKLGGIILGGIMETTFQVIDGLFGSLTNTGTSNRLVKGFIEGFDGIFKDMGGFDGFMSKVNDLFARIANFVGDLIVTKLLPLMFKSLIQFIMAGFKSGPIGALISGGLLALLITGVKALTKSAFNAAVSLQSAATSAKIFARSMAGKNVFGPQLPGGDKGRAAATGAKSNMSKLKQFFLGDVKGTKGLPGAAKAGVKGGPLAGMAEVSKSLKGGLKAGAKLGAIGGIITAITKVSEGQSILDAISGGLASAGGSAIGAAIGTILLGPFGTVLGAWIGGMIADTEAIIAPIRGAIDAIMDSLSSAGQALGLFFGIISDIVVSIVQLIPGMESVGEGFNLLGAAVTVLMMPFRLLGLGLSGIVVALIHFKKFLAGMGVGGIYHGR